MLDDESQAQRKIAQQMLVAFKKRLKETKPQFTQLVNECPDPIKNVDGKIITNPEWSFCINLFDATNQGYMKGHRETRYICLDTDSGELRSCNGDLEYDYTPADWELIQLFEIPGNFKQAMTTLNSIEELKQINLSIQKEKTSSLIKELNEFK